ncbi:MAG: hypothetical protein LBE86_13105 [Gemmobacter sp.]|jgi:hypothetical protein|nr:hypothetical protein [Gemmobacter sp.]
MKNCSTGRYGPSGEHLIAPALHSGEVPGVFLAMAGWEELMAAVRRLAVDDEPGGSEAPREVAGACQKGRGRFNFSQSIVTDARRLS